MTTGSDIPSARNLRAGGFGPGTPLRDFQGVLNSIVREEDAKRGTLANLNFTDLVVFESIEPYPHPVATIKIKESSMQTSGWGIMSGTLCELMPEHEDLKDQIGSVLRFKWVPGHNPDGSVAKRHDLGFKDQNWEPAKDDEGNIIQSEADRPNVIVDAWEVMELNGVPRGAAAMTARDQAIALLDGQTKAGFNKATMTDSLIKGDDTFRATIVNGTFLAEMVSSGAFVLGEDQVYRKAAPAEAGDEPF